MAFSRPATTTAAPKTALCSGFKGYANDSGFVMTAEHGSANATHELDPSETVSTGGRTSETCSATHTGDQRIPPYSCSQVYRKQQSGEVCRKCLCSHLCKVAPPAPPAAPPASPPDAVQQASGWTSPSVTPPGPGPSDNDSDPDSVYSVPVDVRWHSMDKHSGNELAASLLQYSDSLYSYSYPMDNGQAETDHGCSHAAAAESHDVEPFVIPWSVQETPTQGPGQQELVITEPLQFTRIPNQRRDSLNEGRHVYTKPFVCNMPELQPSFVGEMRSEFI